MTRTNSVGGRGEARDGRSALAASARARGLTLVELVIALAVTGILAGLAAPSFASLMRDAQLRSSTHQVLAALFLTRSEAIKRSRRVTMCTSRDQLTCAANIGWHSGWIVFDDANGNGLREAGENLILVQGALSDGLAVTGNGVMRDYVSYLPSGATRRVSGAWLMGTITACKGGMGRQIVISASGRPRVVAAADC